jgi:hypothetical protein
MKQHKNTTDIRNVAELKKMVIANAIASGNTFAFHNLFSAVREFSGGKDENEITLPLLDRVRYLIPQGETLESPKFRAALELVEKHDLKGDMIPAVFLEETAKEAVARGNFAYAEDAYRLLGAKKEMVALYAQTGEHLLRESKAKEGALSFFVAASLEQPIGPHFQYLGPELHSKCLTEPQKCVTNLPLEELVDTGIRFLLQNDALAERLLAAVRPEQRKRILATLAVCRDLDLSESIANLRAATAELSKIVDGKPDEYSSIGPTLLGRPTGTNESWQYLKEFCLEHPVGSLGVCLKRVRDKIVLIPVIRDGKSLLDLLLPPEFLAT